MLSEKRKSEILQKLQQERQQRLQLSSATTKDILADYQIDVINHASKTTMSSSNKTAANSGAPSQTATLSARDQLIAKLLRNKENSNANNNNNNNNKNSEYALVDKSSVMVSLPEEIADNVNLNTLKVTFKLDKDEDGEGKQQEQQEQEQQQQQRHDEEDSIEEEGKNKQTSNNIIYNTDDSNNNFHNKMLYQIDEDLIPRDSILGLVDYNALLSHLQRDSNNNDNSNNNPSTATTANKKRISKLAQPKSYEYLEKQRKVLQDEDLKECTFKPQITAPAAAGISTTPKREKTMLEKRKKWYDEELKDCTFTPNIKTAEAWIDRNNYIPIHKRVGIVQREKQAKLNELKSQAIQQNMADASFTPAVSSLSTALAKKKRMQRRKSSSSFSSRVSEDDDNDQEDNLFEELSKMKKCESNSSATILENQAAADEVFRPHISANSRQIVSKKEEFTSESFLQRQQRYERKRESKQAELASKMQVKQSNKPEISDTSRLLAERRLSRRGESEEEQSQRLYFNDKQSQDIARIAAREIYYSQFSFQPDINNFSRTLAPSNVDELVNNEKGKRHREIVQQLAEEEQSRICTFKPDIGKTQRPPAVRYEIDLNNTEQVLEQIQRKREERERQISFAKEMIMQREEEECTFKPSINKKPVQTQKPIIIRGLGNFLERTERQKQMEEEKRRREEKVFNMNAKGNLHGMTIQEPFNLSSTMDAMKRKRDKLLEELQQKEVQECTFKPRINDYAEKKLIDFLLNTNDHDDNNDYSSDI